jgi:hypothetical protein
VSDASTGRLSRGACGREGKWRHQMLGVVAPACNPCTREAEGCEFEASLGCVKS